MSALITELRERRIALGMSQVAVARASHTQQSAISEMESGRVVPMLSTFERYAQAVGLAVVLREFEQ